MISIIFIILASICNAIMDNLTHHWYKSKFNKYNPVFWNPEVSWKYAKMLAYTKYKVDAWHIFKSLMIIFLCGSIVVYSPLIHPIADFLILGVTWNLVFNLFYNRLLNN